MFIRVTPMLLVPALEGRGADRERAWDWMSGINLAPFERVYACFRLMG
jgi:hypothetical protein